MLCCYICSQIYCSTNVIIFDDYSVNLTVYISHIIKFSKNVVSSVPLSHRRDSGTLSRQWDSLDEPFFCDWSQVEVVYQAVNLW